MTGLPGCPMVSWSGVLCAWDRVEAHAAARKLAAIAELARRNPGPEDAEFTADRDRLRTGRVPGPRYDLLDLAGHLDTRLPGTRAALLDGTLSLGKARLIATATALLDPDEAAAAEDKVLDRAARLTPGGLRAAIARAVIEAAPEKARERRETAARFARVERWAEDSGNAALMGRELPPDEVLARGPADLLVGRGAAPGRARGRHGRAARPGLAGPAAGQGLPPPPAGRRPAGRDGGSGRPPPAGPAAARRAGSPGGSR